MILLAGASGKLGREIESACMARGLEIACPPRSELDISDEGAVEAAMERYRPWAVINAASARMGDGEPPARLLEAAGRGPENLARASARRSAQFMTFSSDRVFDGRLMRPYVEGDDTSPSCLAGLGKVEAERRVARVSREALIIRMSRLFGVGDDPQELFERCLQRVGSRAFLTATYMPDVVRAALDLLIDGESGTWHLSSSGAMSPDEFWRIFPSGRDYDPPPGRLILLASERAPLMPSLGDALVRQRDVFAAGSEPMPMAAE